MPFAVSAQAFAESQRIGNFKSAGSFYINDYGSIFVADDAENEVYKFDNKFARTELIGGFGWSIESFDQPVDVFANTLNVYITDKNNNRIQIFDKDLNFLSVFPPAASDEDLGNFSYPEAAEESPLGEVFILDSDESRLLRFGLTGRFISEIGGYDAGDFALDKPTDFAISAQSNLFVTDNSWIKSFDRFGNGLQKIDAGIEAVSISIYQETALVTDGKTLFAFKISGTGISAKKRLYLADEEDTLVEAAIFGKHLFILTKREIIVLEILNPIF